MSRSPGNPIASFIAARATSRSQTAESAPRGLREMHANGKYRQIGGISLLAGLRSVPGPLGRPHGLRGDVDSSAPSSVSK